MALANHHDGFDTWDSKYHGWNAGKIAPKRDVIGAGAAAARQQGFPFGLLSMRHETGGGCRWPTSAISLGPLKGVPYYGHLTKEFGKGQGGKDSTLRNSMDVNTAFTKILMKNTYIISITESGISSTSIIPICYISTTVVCRSDGPG